MKERKKERKDMQVQQEEEEEEGLEIASDGRLFSRFGWSGGDGWILFSIHLFAIYLIPTYSIPSIFE